MSRLLFAFATALLAGCFRDATPASPPPAAFEAPAPVGAAPAPVARSAPSSAATPTLTPAPTMCDEVPCDHPDACCDDTKRWRKPPPRPSRTTLDRRMIVDAIAGVKPQILACGSAAAAKGTVKVRVVIAPDGGVTSVTVAHGIDPAIDSCVAAAVQQATFEATDAGGAFAYPFVF